MTNHGLSTLCRHFADHAQLEDALGLSAMVGKTLADARTGNNGRHALVGCCGRPSLDDLPDTNMSNVVSKFIPAWRCDERGAQAENLSTAPSARQNVEVEAGLVGKFLYDFDDNVRGVRESPQPLSVKTRAIKGYNTREVPWRGLPPSRS